MFRGCGLTRLKNFLSRGAASTTNDEEHHHPAWSTEISREILGRRGRNQFAGERGVFIDDFASVCAIARGCVRLIRVDVARF